MSDQDARRVQEHWPKASISDLAEVVTKGTTPTSVGYEFTEEGINFVKIESISSRGHFLPEKFAKISCECHESLRRSQLQEGDILFSIAGALGRTAIVRKDILPANTNQAIALIRLKSGLGVDRHFLLYALSPSLMMEQVEKQRGGVAQQNLSLAQLKDFRVPLPPLDEQKRIVAALDQAFAALDRARAHAEANLADAATLFVQVAYDNLKTIVEKGKLVHVGEIGEHCLGKMLDKNKNKGTFRPYLRNINVRWFEIDTSDVLEMRIEDRELDRYEVHKGDLLICEGGYPGRASIYQSDDSTYFQKALHRVRFDDEVLPKVLMYWLFVEDKLGTLKQHFSGTGISHFTGKALASYRMPVSGPTTNAGAVNNIDRCLVNTKSLVSSYQEKLQALANLRQSLLQKAFAGDLV